MYAVIYMSCIDWCIMKRIHFPDDPCKTSIWQITTNEQHSLYSNPKLTAWRQISRAGRGIDHWLHDVTFTHRMLVKAVGQKHRKVARLQMALDLTIDPPKEKMELMSPRSQQDVLNTIDTPVSN